MSNWLRETIVVLIGLFLACFIVACGGGKAEGESNLEYEGTALSGAAADFALTDQNNNRISLSSFYGKIAVIGFLDPECTDVCLLTTFHFQQANQQLTEQRDQIVFLGVNVNVEQNSREVAVAETEKWGLTDVDNWHFLFGDAEDLQSVWHDYGIYAGDHKHDKPEEVAHTPGVYIIDTAGEKRWYISIPADESAWEGPSLSELLVKHIRSLLKE